MARTGGSRSGAVHLHVWMWTIRVCCARPRALASAALAYWVALCMLEPLSTDALALKPMAFALKPNMRLGCALVGVQARPTASIHAPPSSIVAVRVPVRRARCRRGGVVSVHTCRPPGRPLRRRFRLGLRLITVDRRY
jgi:hypothetical protein